MTYNKERGRERDKERGREAGKRKRETGRERKRKRIFKKKYVKLHCLCVQTDSLARAGKDVGQDSWGQF